MKKSLLLSGGTAGVALVEKKKTYKLTFISFFFKKRQFPFFFCRLCERERRYVCCFSILADEGGEDAKFNFFLFVF